MTVSGGDLMLINIKDHNNISMNLNTYKNQIRNLYLAVECILILILPNVSNSQFDFRWHG